MKNSKYREALANKVLSNLEKNEDKNFQKEVLENTSTEQLAVLQKVTKEKKNSLQEQSENDHEIEIQNALDAVDGWGQFASYSSERTVSAEEKKLGTISSAIDKEIRKKAKEQSAQTEQAVQPQQEASKWTEKPAIQSKKPAEEFREKESFVSKTRIAVQGNYDIPPIPEESQVSFVDAEAQRENSRNNPSQEQDGAGRRF